MNGAPALNDDDSSDWEEASEEGSEADALEVHGLPPGQNILDIAAAAAAAHDHVDSFAKVTAIMCVHRRHACASGICIGAVSCDMLDVSDERKGAGCSTASLEREGGGLGASVSTVTQVTSKCQVNTDMQGCYI